MDDFASILVESAEIAADQKVKEAKFDATIQAKIISCEDQNKAKYKCKYQDSYFYAYGDVEGVKYNTNTDVYVLVPSNDFSKTKKILGSVNNLSTDYISVIEGTEDSFDKIGTDLIQDSGEFALRSGWSRDITKNYIVLYDAGNPSASLVSIDAEAAKEYLNKAEYFSIAANFRTDLATEQQYYGTYTLKVTMIYKSKASGELKTIPHTLTSLEMTGQPYTFIEKSRQFKAFQYTDMEFVSVSKIEFLCSGFPIQEDKDIKDDLFISDLELYAVKPIPQEELTKYHVSLKTPNGSVFWHDATKELPIEATFKVNGNMVDSSTLDFYWFLEDNTITTESQLYNDKGGVGWRCLNEYTIIPNETGTNDYIQWKTKGKSIYKVQKADLFVETSIIKCVVDYEGSKPSATQEIINKDSVYSIDIWSDQINDKGTIAWYNDEGVTDLKCRTYFGGVETTTNLSYTWAKTNAYGEKVPINTEGDEAEYAIWVDYVQKADAYTAENPGLFYLSQYPLYNEYKEKIAAYENKTIIDGQWLRNVKAIDIDTMATYLVTVTYTNQETLIQTVLGTAKLVITNGKSTGGYILNINQPPLYKYDTEGVSPAAESKGSEAITIEPMSFILLDSMGSVMSGTSILSNFNLRWIFPATNSMIAVTDPAAVLSDDGSVYYIDNKVEALYGIAATYSVEKGNNTVTLELRGKEDESLFIQGIVTLLFTKEGGIGTNGTEYNVTIELASQKDNDYTDRVDIPIVKIKNYSTSPSLSPINFNTNGGKWLKFTFWKNGEKIFEGVDSNTLPGYSGLKTLEGKTITNLKWEMSDKDSYYSLSSSGKFTPSGQIKSLNACNVVKVSFLYYNVYYSGYLPIVSVLADNNDYTSALQIGGFLEVLYNANGKKPMYNQAKPFNIKTMKDEDDVSNDLDYKWDVTGTEPNLEIKESTKKYMQEAEPVEYYFNGTTDDAIVAYCGMKEWYPDAEWRDEHPIDEDNMTTEEIEAYEAFLDEVAIIQANTEYTEEEKAAMIQVKVKEYKNIVPFYLSIYNTVHIPIHFLLNRYGNIAINDWDGTAYVLNEEKDTLLIPQLGAGRKEVDNSFTGMLMGVVNVKSKKSSDVGLFGYSSGERTFLLDSKTGKVEAGIGESRITIDPSNSTAQISANYSTTRKTGMLIDLTDPSIHFGNGCFSVDSEGKLEATGVKISGEITATDLNAKGSTIGNFKISEDALLMGVEQKYEDLYYNKDTHKWNFEDSIDGDDSGTTRTDEEKEEIVYRRLQAAATIYFGSLGLNLGKIPETQTDAKPYFLVKNTGDMYCRKAHISDAAYISSHSIDSNNIIIETGGTLKHKNNSFTVKSDGETIIKTLRCGTLYAEHIVDPKTEGEDMVLVGPSLSLNYTKEREVTTTDEEGKTVTTIVKDSIPYLTIDKENGIDAQDLNYKSTGEIYCNELNVNGILSVDANGVLNTSKIIVTELDSNKLNIVGGDYIFTSGDEYAESGKYIGNVKVLKGRVLEFSAEKMIGDNIILPHIIGWSPEDEEGNVTVGKPNLELVSGYKVLINSPCTDIQTSGTNGKVSFTHYADYIEEVGDAVAEEYATLSPEGLKLHKGGDTLVSMLDGTYYIPYPPEGKYYDKIFTLDGYEFSSVYLENPSEAQQGIDLSDVFGSIKPEDISTQICISIDLKGIVTSVSEVVEADIEDPDKQVRNFYINFNRIPTKEEFGKDAIELHWSVFFFKKN